MKQKLLFVNPSMDFGGAEKSLQTLLTLIDSDKYDIDLFLLRREGKLMELVPPTVNILESPEAVKAFSLPLIESCRYFLSNKMPMTALNRFLFSRSVRSGVSDRQAMQISWKYQKKAFPQMTKQYDAAIAYLEGSSIYYCADKVNAKKKIAYIHSDYKKLQMDRDFDSRYFDAFDSIVTVSGECAQSLCEVFPEHKEKIRVIENIISPASLKKQASADKGFVDDFDGKRILTMGRLEEPKGIDIALEACEILSKRHNIRWYVLGEGSQRESLTRMIQEKGLSDRFILPGATINPYPYLSECDIYVQPSRFEGKSIALEEAKSFKKPIVTTDFTTVRDQITDNVTGLIAKADAKDIAEKIENLLTDESLADRLSDNLSDYTGNENEISVFYDIICLK